MVATLFACAMASAALWGFTVDDALITCRYAHHIATGRGYRFNPSGPSTDGVTPLGYAYLIAPFAGRSALGALDAAKVIGAVAHAVGAAFVVHALSARGELRRLGCFGPALWIVAAPAAAWSASGLETSFVEGLVAVGVSLRFRGVAEPWGVLVLGLAAGLRPELMPMVAVLSMPRAQEGARAGADEDAPPRPPIDARAFGRLGIAIAPFVLAATVRVIAFGRPNPLSALAKPADVRLGASYAIVCMLVTGFAGLVAPLVIVRGRRYVKWLVVAAFTHAAAVAFAGGDWMPVSRLFVPVLPVIALASGSVASASRLAPGLLRVALALAGEVYVWIVVGEKLVRVERDRRALIEQMRGPLASSRVIAGLDIGWLGAAAPDATVVDLAGVTDPEIAALPGGHLTKKIPDGLLETRKTDTLVFQLYKDVPVAEPWEATTFARGIEIYVATAPHLGERFAPAFVREGRARYVVLTRRDPPTE